MTVPRKTLEEYLALEYPFHVVADREGGYVILYPDLPGCVTQVERLDEIPEAAEEIRCLWIETEYAEGADIPLPSYPEEYSGKFNLRLPKSLHRELAEAAEREGVSLNQYVVMLLSRRDVEVGVERRLEGVDARLGELCGRLTYHLGGQPAPNHRRDATALALADLDLSVAA